MEYEFTTDWLSRFGGVWDQLIARYPPSRALEIGCWEGRATTFLIERCAKERPFAIVCCDTWAGGVEHDPAAMADVERRFDANVAKAASAAAHPVEVQKRKGSSLVSLPAMLAEGQAGTFDFIYVDGSHQAPDVLTDAVLAFRLAKVGGVMVFDDYLWAMEPSGQQDHYNMPKPAIDAFVNIFQRKLAVIGAPLYQLYVRKLSN